MVENESNTKNRGDLPRRQFLVTLQTEGWVVYKVEATSEEEAKQSWQAGQEVDWSDQLMDEVTNVLEVEEIKEEE